MAEFKQSRHVFVGMNRDTSPALADRSKYYFDAKNIRINVVDNETLFCITNEQKTKSLELTINGTYLGHAIINNYLVVFSTNNNTDYITRYEIKDDRVISTQPLFKGNLNFKADHKIETIVYYLNEDNQNVYWVDGINQPRCINIVAKSLPYSGNNSQFDFTLDVSDNTLYLEIEKEYDVFGTFKGGTVQYFLTAIGVNKQESGILYQSPLYYPSNRDRAVGPEETANCRFNINVKYFQPYNNRVNSNIDKIRIYAVHRTSTDTDAYCRVVKDIKYSDITDRTSIGESTTEQTSRENTAFIYNYTINDDGTLGETYDVRSLLLKQGTAFSASAIAQKDEALFLGNLTILNKDINIDSYINKFKTSVDNKYSWKNNKKLSIEFVDKNSYYKYSNQLDKSSYDIQTFKYGEYYRFGIQLQDKYGNWSSPIHIADVLNNDYEHKSYSAVENEDTIDVADNYYLTKCYLALDDLLKVENDSRKTLYNYLIENDIIKIRPLVIFPERNKRNVIAQGVVNPTVFNLGWREQAFQNNTQDPYAQASWFFRPFYIGKLNESEDWDTTKLEYDVTYVHKITRGGDTQIKYLKDINWPHHTIDLKKGSALAYRHFSKIRGSWSKMGEVQSASATDYPLPIKLRNVTRSSGNVNPITHSEDFYVDQSIATLNSPDIDFDNFDFIDNDNYKIRLLGVINIRKTVGKIYLQVNGTDNVGVVAEGKNNESLTISDGYKGLINTPARTGGLFVNDGSDQSFPGCYGNYVCYPFQTTGSISGISQNNNILQRKIIANLRYAPNYIKFDNPKKLKILDINYANSSLTKLKIGITSGYKEVYYHKDVNRNLQGIPFNLGTKIWISGPDRGIRCLSSIGGTYSGSYTWAHAYNNIEYEVISSALEASGTSLREAFNGNTIEYENFDTLNLDINTAPYLTFRKYTTEYHNSRIESPYETPVADKLTSIAYSSTNHLVFSLPVINYQPSDPTYNLPRCLQTVLPTIYKEDEMYDKDNARIYGAFQGFSEKRQLSANEYIHKTYTNAYSTDYCNQTNTNARILTYMTSTGTGARSREYYEDIWGAGTNGILCEDPNDNEFTHDVLATGELDNNIQGLYLAEVYKEEDESVALPFDSNENNTDQKWLIGGDAITLINKNNYRKFSYFNGELSPSIEIPAGTKEYRSYDEGSVLEVRSSIVYPKYNELKYSTGDTYYQRYDCLKTYPHPEGTDNNIVEILSFMCESHVNLASRFDKLRGLRDNTIVEDTIFNLLNTGYTQNNNLLTYSKIEDKVTKFSNQITWSLVKNNSKTVDSWTNMTLANIYNLDGSHGEIVALKNYKGHLLSFQKDSVDEIIYNPNIQISTANNIPVEIANSTTVTGVRNLLSNCGTTNKWSICTTEEALYFVDDYNNSIYQYSDKPVSLSDSKGLRKWVIDYKNINTYYDKYNKDLYFYNGIECLTFNEVIGQFVSRIDYTPDTMFNIDDSFYDISNKELSKHNEGGYTEGMIEFIENDNPTYDKTFTNIELRADVYNNDTVEHDISPIATVQVKNEYQDTEEIPLSYSRGKLGLLQKKFRQWRIDIPRDGGKILKGDRIRNTWSKIRLTTPAKKIKLYDATVQYYI